MTAFTAYTREIDDVEAAVAEVLEQLNLEQNMRKNAVGIISCYSEFVDSGVVAALCDALPFDVVGCTTIANATAGEVGFTMLNLVMLTGDDVFFSTAVSEDLSDEQEKTLQNAYDAALKGQNGEVKLVMAYGPIINNVGGERIVEMLDKACGGTPIFGTLAMDHTEDYHLAQIIYNGESSRTKLSMLLISGDINPRFSVYAIPEEKVMHQKAVVTKSEGNVLIEVNNIPFLEYMGTLGLVASDDSIEGLITIPLMVDYNDGTTPVARAMYMANENGHAVCGGKMPVGSTISIGTLAYEDVVNSARAMSDEILAINGGKLLLMYPCLSRSLVLGLDAEVELNTICSKMSGKIPYAVAYSGGEICPVSNEDGDLVNRVHNFSLISCLM